MIEAVATWIATAVTASLTAALGAELAAVVGFVVGWGTVLAGLTVISNMLMPKMPEAVAQAQRILRNYKGTDSPLRVIYGEVRCGGDIVFEDITGTEGEYYWIVIALGATNGAPYEAVSHIYLDDHEYDLTADFSSNVLQVGKWANLVWVKAYLGDDDQTADATLSAASTPWTSNHKGQGMCYAIIRLTRDDEVFNHIPEFSFKVKGAKIYDPRLDSTNGGSGTHRDGALTDSPNPALTWEWSDNPALILRDYIRCSRYGMGEVKARIDDVTVAAAANTCDESVNVPGGSQQRYLCNGILNTNTAHIQNIAAIRSAMCGIQTYSRGKHKIFAGEYTAPTVTLTDDDLSGGISVQSIRGSELYNSVRGKYLSADRKWQWTSFVPRTDAAYVTEDNGETLWNDIELPMVTNEYRAQRIATIILRQSRNKLTVDANFNLKAYKLELFETVAITNSELGWSSKVFRVLGWKFNPDGTVNLALQEDASSIWDDPSVGSYGTPGNSTATPYPTPTPSDIPAPIVVTPVTGGLVVSWTAPGDNSAQYYDVAEYTANTPVSSATIVSRRAATEHTRHFSTPTTRYYWVRPVGYNGQTGNWTGVTVGGNGVGDTSIAPLATYSQLTQPVHSVFAQTDGTGYSLTSAGGTHKVYSGGADVTTSATHSIVGTQTKNGLTISVVAGTGVYSLDDGSPVGVNWTTNEESFTLRATYDGVDYDQVYTITKALAGSPGSSHAGTNVTDWETYAANIAGVDSGIQFKVDFANNYLYVRPKTISGTSGLAWRYCYDLEVMHSTVTAFESIASNAAWVNDAGTPYTASPVVPPVGALLWGVDDAAGVNNGVYGTNGVIHYEALNQTGSSNDEYRLTLDSITADTTIRLKIRRSDKPNIAISLGNKWAQYVDEMEVLDRTYNQIYFSIQAGQIIVWQGSLAAAPSNPQLNWAYYNTSTGIAYIWDGDSWEQLAADGADGTNGNTSFFGSVYKRSADSPDPATPTGGSYNFDTQTLTPPAGWFIAPPVSDGNPLWISNAIFEISGTSGTDNSATWTTPLVLVSDGVDGSNGSNGSDGNSSIVCLVYKRSADSPAPATPSVNDGSYNFTSETLTPPTGWFVSPPSSDGNPLWVSSGIFEIAGTTGTDNTVTWTTPQIMVSDGTDGTNGTPGTSIYNATIYKRTADSPAPTAPTGGSYNFATETLSPPSTWSTTPPALDGNPLFSSQATFSWDGVASPAVDSTTTWSTPVQLDNGLAQVAAMTAISAYSVAAVPSRSAGVRVHTDGTIDTMDDGVWSNDQTWLLLGTNSMFECMFSVTSEASTGTGSSSGTYDTWQVCSTTRTWQVSATGDPSEYSKTGYLYFRRKSDSQTLAIIACSIAAEVI